MAKNCRGKCCKIKISKFIEETAYFSAKIECRRTTRDYTEVAIDAIGYVISRYTNSH